MNNANKYHSYCITHCYLTIDKILFFGEKSLLFFLENYYFLNDEYSKHDPGLAALLIFTILLSIMYLEYVYMHLTTVTSVNYLHKIQK